MVVAAAAAVAAAARTTTTTINLRERDRRPTALLRNWLESSLHWAWLLFLLLMLMPTC